MTKRATAGSRRQMQAAALAIQTRPAATAIINGDGSMVCGSGIFGMLLSSCCTWVVSRFSRFESLLDSSALV
eukprot:26029_5